MKRKRSGKSHSNRKESEMKVKATNRIMNSVSKESSRYAISSALLSCDVNNAWLAGTDGRMAVVRPVDIVHEEDDAIEPVLKILPQDMMKKSSAKNSKKCLIEIKENDATLTPLDRDSLPSGLAQTGECEEGSFPPFGDVFPTSSGVEYASVCLDGDLLKRLIDAVVTDTSGERRTVFLYIPLKKDIHEKSSAGHVVYDPASKAILMTSGEGTVNAGVLMPVNGEGQEIVRLEEAKDMFTKASPAGLG